MIRVAATLVLATLLSLCLTPLLRAIALRLGIVDRPDGRLKTHAAPVPYLGGVAIYLSFLLAGLATLEPQRDVLAILLAGAVVMLVGLLDDVRPLGPGLKLTGQAGAVAVLLAAPVQMEATFLPWWLTLLASVLWLLGTTNAFNLIDVMDGLAAGVGCVAALVLAAIALGHDRAPTAILLAALAGSLAGFLRYNVEPARIYMGDAGSLCVGLLLGALALNNGYTDRNVVAALSPAIILGLPLLDLLFVAYVRWRRGAPILRGSPDHVPLRLRRWRLSVRQTVGASYAGSALLGAIGVSLVLVETPAAIALAAVTLGAALALTVSLRRIELRRSAGS